MTDDIERLLGYGRMGLEAGQYEQAREDFEKVLALDPSNREAMKGLARVNEILNRRTSLEPVEIHLTEPIGNKMQRWVNSAREWIRKERQEYAEIVAERKRLTAQKRDGILHGKEAAPVEPMEDEPVEPRREPEPLHKVVVDATDLPTVLVAVLDAIKQEGLNIIAIHHPGGQSLPPGDIFDPRLSSIFLFKNEEGLRWEDRGKLLIRAEPGFSQRISGYGPFDVAVSSSGVEFSPQTYAAQHAAATFQSILKAQQYPSDSEEIIDYAKQLLAGVGKEQRELLLDFLQNWIQQAETIGRLAERVDEEPLNPNAYFELAEALTGLGRHDAAEEYYLKALALTPMPRVAGLANLRLGRMKMYPRTQHHRIQDGRIKLLGGWEGARYRLEQSVRGLEEYIRTHPNDAKAWRELQIAYFNLGSVYDVWRLDKPQAMAAAYDKGERARMRANILESLASVQEKVQESPLEASNGLAFEEKCLRLIRAMGFHAQTTKRTGDGGIDIIATSTQPLLAGEYVIQCKDWSTPVGVSPVRDLYGVVAGTRANKGILITSSTFTKSAQDFAQGKQLELIDGEELERLSTEYM